MRLCGFVAYGLGHTPLHRARAYCSKGNLYLKLEGRNPHGSIKDRTAYYIIKDLIDSGQLRPGTKLVESTSGNLGTALAFFAREVGVRFVCLCDPTIPKTKLKQLEAAGVEVTVVPLDHYADYRSARIHLARELGQEPGCIWTNQYDNPANYKSHFETTGPEIWDELAGQVDYLVCSVGTGGTVCGVGCYLKQQQPGLKVVAVEPMGSTIFGGVPGAYLNVGAGMHCQSGILQRHGAVIDYFCKVHDEDAIRECVRFRSIEAISVGVTTGSVLVVASQLATKHPDKHVAAISPDGGLQYEELLLKVGETASGTPEVHLVEYHP